MDMIVQIAVVNQPVKLRPGLISEASVVSGQCGRFGHVGHQQERRQETAQFTFWKATVIACTFALSHPEPDPRCSLISSNRLAVSP